MQLPEIRGDMRIFGVGKTRSGKSFYFRYILKVAVASGWRVFIIDPKKDWMSRIEDGKRIRLPYGELSKEFRGSVDKPILVTDFDPTIKVAIIEPYAWKDDRFNLDKTFKAIRDYGNTIIYIDEVTQLVNGALAPKEFTITYTQGAAVGVGVWAGTQRPHLTPSVMRDQAEIWVIFRVKSKDDRMDIIKYLPTSEFTVMYLEDALPDRWFIFYADGMQQPVLFPPLEIKGAMNNSPVKEKSRIVELHRKTG